MMKKWLIRGRKEKDMIKERKERRMQRGAGGARQKGQEEAWIWVGFVHVGVSSLDEKLHESSL